MRHVSLNLDLPLLPELCQTAASGALARYREFDQNLYQTLSYETMENAHNSMLSSILARSISVSVSFNILPPTTRWQNIRAFNWLT